MESGDYILILLQAGSPVSGGFTAWQDTPFEKQLLGLSLLLVGLAGIGDVNHNLKKELSRAQRFGLLCALSSVSVSVAFPREAAFRLVRPSVVLPREISCF